MINRNCQKKSFDPERKLSEVVEMMTRVARHQLENGRHVSQQTTATVSFEIRVSKFYGWKQINSFVRLRWVEAERRYEPVNRREAVEIVRKGHREIQAAWN